MFSDQAPAPAGSEENFGSQETRKPRRQYTIKGVEDEAVDLMRRAAQAEGVKIGHWASNRLKEAARRALDEARREQHVLSTLVADDADASPSSYSREVGDSLLERRVRQLELELHETVKLQRELLLMLNRSLLSQRHP